MPLSKLIRSSGRFLFATTAVAIIAGCGEQSAGPATPTTPATTDANAGLLTLVLTPGVMNFVQADPNGPLPKPIVVIASNSAALIPSTGIQVTQPKNISGPTAAWLKVETRILGLTASITGTINPNNLPIGVYHASVDVKVPGTTNSPITLHFWYFKGFYFSDNAEAPGAAVTTGLWHRSQLLPICNVDEPRDDHDCLPAPDEGMWAYWYGSDATGNYNFGSNSGDLTLATFNIPSFAVQPVLMFRTTWDTEDADPCAFDFMYTFLVDDWNNEHFIGEINCSSGWVDNHMPTYTTAGADLTEFRGQNWRLRFRFITGDGQFNDYRGWIVDHVVVAEPGFFTGSGYPNPIDFSDCSVQSGPPAECAEVRDGTNSLGMKLGGFLQPPTLRRRQ